MQASKQVWMAKPGSNASETTSATPEAPESSASSKQYPSQRQPGRGRGGNGRGRGAGLGNAFENSTLTENDAQPISTTSSPGSEPFRNRSSRSNQYVPVEQRYTAPEKKQTFRQTGSGDQRPRSEQGSSRRGGQHFSGRLSELQRSPSQDVRATGQGAHASIPSQQSRDSNEPQQPNNQLRRPNSNRRPPPLSAPQQSLLPTPQSTLSPNSFSSGRMSSIKEKQFLQASSPSSNRSPSGAMHQPNNRLQNGRTGPGRRGHGGLDSSIPLSELTVRMIEALSTNVYECMICYDKVKRHNAIWSCRQCYAIFHLSCARKWSQANAASEGDSLWRCPGCQYVNVDHSLSHMCFCGKLADPPSDPYLVPHSCGEPCGRQRIGTSCPHRCVTPCHPGPCPPCDAPKRSILCACGKTKMFVRCSDSDVARSCDKVCGKVLECGAHSCVAMCHSGPCAPCSETIQQHCYCTRVSEARPCGSGTHDTVTGGHFSCPNPCNKALDCGHHTCSSTCHPGQCKGCELLPDRVRTCPCGATSLAILLKMPRSTCMDSVPTCSNMCRKVLPCGHNCLSTCHTGPCPPCTTQVVQTCRCGGQRQSVECSAVTDGLMCDRSCSKLKNCKRHRCSLKCCPTGADPSDKDGVHICRLECGKKLKCGSHACDLLCHSGHCPPCPWVGREPISCSCGKTVQQPPIPCGAPLPACSHPCSVQRPCGHSCKSACHPGSCPPCPVLVDRTCIGGHGFHRKVPCHIAVVSCGRLCAKELVCGEHTCDKTCHPPPCPGRSIHDEGSQELIGQSCRQPCNFPREPCNHPCTSICHPNMPHPDIPCPAPVTVYCDCKRLSKDAKCNEDLHIECDDECRSIAEVEERNRKLADALDITPKTSDQPGATSNAGVSGRSASPPYRQSEVVVTRKKDGSKAFSSALSGEDAWGPDDPDVGRAVSAVYSLATIAAPAPSAPLPTHNIWSSLG